MTKWTDEGPYIELNYLLRDDQRQLTMIHELHHLSIGGVCRSQCPRNEAKVLRATARWAIPDVERLAVDLRRKSVGRVAHDLGLPTAAVFARLRYATPKERQVLHAVMQRKVARAPEGKAAHLVLADAAYTGHRSSVDR